MKLLKPLAYSAAALLFAAAGVVVLSLSVRRDSMADLPDDPDGLTVYSIDGPARNNERMTPEQEKGEKLFGYPVLGSVEVTDAERRRAVVSALKDGAKYRGMTAGCFNPRHVVRAVKHGREVYAVLCFECRNYEFRREGVGMRTGSGKMDPDRQPVLDELLTEAGVPLAPKTCP